jgi:hypothetical protein
MSSVLTVVIVIPHQIFLLRLLLLLIHVIQKGRVKGDVVVLAPIRNERVLLRGKF